MLKHLVLRAIRRYQNTGGSKQHFRIECNFSPTCSEYTYQAIEKFGLIKGVKLGINRIKRCNDPNCINPIHDPLHQPGLDNERR